MSKILAFFGFLVLWLHSNSQNIYSALHLNEERSYKTIRPKKTINTNIFFTSKGKEAKKEIDLFDMAGMLMTEERFDKDGNLTDKLTFLNDTVNRIILSETFERWTTYGYSKESTIYTYDSSHFLIRIETKNDKGIIIRVSEIKNNKNGNPVELSLYDGNGNSFGKEIADYNYETNQVITSVIANDGRILSSNTEKISFENAHLHPWSRETYNQNGDCLIHVSKSFDGKETIYEEEYIYDELGNCLENKIYKIILSDNGERKREIDRIFKKKYKY